MAEAALRSELKKRKIPWIAVRSAGTGAEAGNAMSPLAAEALKNAAIPVSPKFRSRKLTEKMIKEGNDAFNQGHDVHLDLLAKEAGGESSGGGLLMMHAEDQLMSAEGFHIIADEFIELYKKING